MRKLSFSGHRVGRLPIQFGAAFALAMLVVGVVVSIAAETRITGSIDDALRRHSAKYLAPVAGHPPSRAVILDRIDQWQRRKVMSERSYLLFDHAGRRIAGRLDLAPPPVGFSDVQFLAGGRTPQLGRALASRMPDGDLFAVVQHSEAASSLRALMVPLVMAIFVAAILAGLAATFLFASLTAKRLVGTLNAADSIAAGDLSGRIDTSRLDGMFAVQANSLNRMLDRMEEMVTSQRQFSSNLAHDLRTPLTRLRGMLLSSIPDGAHTQMLKHAERECASIIAIFDALLRLAEIETGRHPTAMRPLFLRPLLEDVVETLEPVIADRGSELALGHVEDKAILGDADLVNQLLVNLIENIANHTPPGTRAELSLESTPNESVLLTIRDNGPGLSVEERSRVIQPFERGSGGARSRGNGLGLAIAQAIVRFHHGQLDFADNAPGLVVLITLPTLSGQRALPAHA